MIIVDTALKSRAEMNRPIRVGIVGAGFMGRSITNQIIQETPGMTVVAIADRTPKSAEHAYLEAGISNFKRAVSFSSLEEAIARKQRAVSDDPLLLCQAEGIDAIVEATSTVECGARAVLTALEHGKHVILANVELDGTLGPILKVYADFADVVISNCGGNQSGAELNLYRYVKGLGMEPLLCGSIIPSLQDKRRQQDPDTFMYGADPSKVSFEQALVANATGMQVAKRGMVGYQYHGFIDEPEHLAMYDLDHLRSLGSVVDYVVGAKPKQGAYLLAAQEDCRQRKYLELYELGPGPLYCFYTPHHLCHLEVPMTVARAVLFHDAAVTPLAGPVVEVAATAKRDLKAGELLDSIGTYGQCENANVMEAQTLLPLGIAKGCHLKQDIAKDHVLTYDDIELPEGRLCDRLLAEQRAHFSTAQYRYQFS